MSQITETVKQLAAEYAKKLDLEVVEVEYQKKPDGMHMTVFIEKRGGVTLDDCVALHEAIDQPLDDLDPTNGASYVLNVSSLGLDRDINNDVSLSIALGTEVDVNLFAKIDGKKHIDGAVLTSFDKGNVVLQKGKDEISIPRDKISKISKHINF